MLGTLATSCAVRANFIDGRILSSVPNSRNTVACCAYVNYCAESCATGKGYAARGF